MDRDLPPGSTDGQSVSETEERQRHALASAVLTSLTDQDDLAASLEGCARACVDHVGAAFARVWTLNEFDQTLELQASAGLYTHLDGGHSRVPVGEFKIGRIAKSRRPHLTNDVLNDPEVSDHEWANREGMVAFAGYPLIARGHLVGVVALFARHALSAGTLDSLAGIADAIAGAIDRHRTADDRERLLRQLDDQRRLLEAIIDQMPAGVVIAESPSGRLLLANRMAARFGHPLTVEPAPGTEVDLAAWPLGRALAGSTVTSELVHHPDLDHDLVLSVSAAPVRDPSGAVVAAVSTMDDVTDRHLRAQVMQLQHEATEALSDARSLREASTVLLAGIGRVLDATAVTLWLVDPAAAVLRAEDLWLADAELGTAFADASRTLELPPGAGVPGLVWERVAPVWLTADDVDAPTARTQTALDLGVRSGLGVPIVVDGSVIAVLEILRIDSRQVDDRVVATVSGIGAQLGQFMERLSRGSALHASEGRRSAMLAASLDCVVAMDANGRVSEFNPAAEQTFGYARAEILGQPMVELLVPEEHRQAHRDGVARFLRTGDGPVLGKRIELSALRRDGSTFPAELAILPIDEHGRTSFVAYLRDITEQQAGLEELVRSRAHMTRLAQTLQASLIPPILPTITGLEVAGVYRPSGNGTEVGGDFYDLFETAPGDWAIVIGDVCGKGAEAAAVTALARYTIRAAALRVRKPRAILDNLNQALLAQGSRRFVTVVYARVRVRNDQVRVTVACGGHPLPIQLHPDGHTSDLGRPGSLMGVLQEIAVHDTAIDLQPGESVVFYTDGLTEARAGDDFYGEGRLRDLIGKGSAWSAEEMALRLADAAISFQGGTTRDDLAVVVLRRPTQPEHLNDHGK